MSAREPTDGGSLRERKRAAAKARVAEVAIELFAAHGYAAVSVAEICAAAEVAPRSFYRYFPAKEDVLLEPVREMADRAEAALAAAPAQLSDADALAFALRRLAEHMVDHWTRLTAYFDVIRETTAVRASPLVQLADRERSLADQLLARRRATPPPDWQTRLLVARSVAAFRVWLDEVRGGEVADPLAHFDRILAAR
ncbi:TetR/AcrR family transcriptional regulator [Conexibacter arvalis]|uniref:AcrR family transcriptional regulator n=1 Tax=Conexibacter arvalis TaxID=912552 RepID=A0A840I8T8_9ACTN|nr:TetR/AcrR family transcriptional regulator [Conexibacter arvalis]MBB4660663.1 AcrR family transcriptional regulator [Conexibacter arvalis]